MKFYKYYETTDDYEIDAPNIGEDEHYTIYIADTNTSLVNSKYIKDQNIKDSYFVYENSGDAMQIANTWSGIKSAICLNNNQQLDTTGPSEIDTSLITGDIKIWFEFDPNVGYLGEIFEALFYLKEVHGQPFKGLRNFTNVNNLFASCTNLTYISPDLFKDINIQQAPSCFKDCSSLKNIPENLFSASNSLNNVEYCFYGCTALTSIPNNLFVNNKRIINFTNCFSGCTNLTGNTPKGADGIELWDRAGKEGYPSGINGDDCFKGCTKLVEYSLDVDNPIPVEWGGQEAVKPTVRLTPYAQHLFGELNTHPIYLCLTENTNVLTNADLTITYRYGTGSEQTKTLTDVNIQKSSEGIDTGLKLKDSLGNYITSIEVTSPDANIELVKVTIDIMVTIVEDSPLGILTYSTGVNSIDNNIDIFNVGISPGLEVLGVSFKDSLNTPIGGNLYFDETIMMIGLDNTVTGTVNIDTVEFSSVPSANEYSCGIYAGAPVCTLDT